MQNRGGKRGTVNTRHGSSFKVMNSNKKQHRLSAERQKEHLTTWAHIIFSCRFSSMTIMRCPPLTLYVANSTRSPSHIWPLFVQRGQHSAARSVTREISLRHGVTSELCDTFTCHFPCHVSANHSCNLINRAPHYRLKTEGEARRTSYGGSGSLLDWH